MDDELISRFTRIRFKSRNETKWEKEEKTRRIIPDGREETERTQRVHFYTTNMCRCVVFVVMRVTHSDRSEVVAEYVRCSFVH